MAIWDFLTLDEEVEQEEKRVKSTYNPVNVGMFGFSDGVSGDRYTAEQLLSIPVAKACNDLICNSIKTLPIELYERVDDNTVKQVNDDYRLFLLNHEPNSISTGTDFKAKLIQDLLLHGNAYVQIEKDGNKIKGLWNIDAKDVGIAKLVNESMPNIVRDIRIKVTGYKDDLSIDDVMISTVSSPDGGLTGEGVISRGYKTIELALNEIELNKNIMNNGSSPMSIVTVQKNLSPEAQTRLRDSWQKMYQGSNNAGKLILLEEGMKYEKLSYSPQELGLSASRTKTQAEICNLFGVPESMVDSSANTYGNVESSSIRFLQYSIMPYINILESSLNRSILLEKEKDKYFFKVNTDSVLQTTQAERYQALSTGLSAGILTLNEARVKENLSPFDVDFTRFSLGAVLYNPDDSTLFVPNMATTFDAKTKNIINSPDLAKNGIKVEDVKNKQDKNNENNNKNME